MSSVSGRTGQASGREQEASEDELEAFVSGHIGLSNESRMVREQKAPAFVTEWAPEGAGLDLYPNPFRARANAR